MRFIYISGIVGFLLLTVGLPVYLSLQKEPTCFDGELNGNETGIDCGGSCALVCKADTAPLNVIWSRAFKVADGYYNVMAYIENLNFDVQTEIEYTFEVYDKENVLIDDRAGTAFITESGAVPIFEPGIRTSIREPARTFFRITNTPRWVTGGSVPDIKVESEKATNTSDLPRVDAVIRNDEVYEVFDIEVAAIVYDRNGNAMGASRTIVSRLAPRERKDIFFTWSAPFPLPVGRIELIPRTPPQPKR